MMTMEMERIGLPLFYQAPTSNSTEMRARHLCFEPCSAAHAVPLVWRWHSRLPRCQWGPWTQVFRGHIGDKTYVVALWNSPSARTLPSQWRELRRLAAAPDAPRNTNSRFLGWMARWFITHVPACDKLISYQDTAVHTGTIYRAAGWTAEHITMCRSRNRTGWRPGTRRLYRSNMNGNEVDAVPKIRWSKTLVRPG